MTYRAEWTGPARRDMARLPPRVVTAVAAYVVERLAHDPHRRSRPLSGELEGLHGALNGDYRILCNIDDEAQVISIIHVDHRAHAYRSR